jgi:hypothetical protein
MEVRTTEVDFDRLCWHDCHIWGLELRVGNSEEGDWTSDLVFKIDFLVEWICGGKDPTMFRVAPATLAFHGVTDPKVMINWGDSGFQVSLHEMAIDSIERARL